MSMWYKVGQCEEGMKIGLLNPGGARWGSAEKEWWGSLPYHKPREAEKIYAVKWMHSFWEELDPGDKTEPHSPLQPTTASLSRVIHWPIPLGSQEQKTTAVAIQGNPWIAWSRKKLVKSGPENKWKFPSTDREKKLDLLWGAELVLPAGLVSFFGKDVIWSVRLQEKQRSAHGGESAMFF